MTRLETGGWRRGAVAQEAGDLKLETGSWKRGAVAALTMLETGGWRRGAVAQEAGSWRLGLEVRGSGLEAGD